MGTCRLCLSPADMNMFFEDRKVCLKKFLVYTNLKIYKNDGFPQHICLVCLQKLEAIITFISQCEESDRTLRSDSDIKPATITIYNEFIDELKSFNVDDDWGYFLDDNKSTCSDDSVDNTFDIEFSDYENIKQNKKFKKDLKEKTNVEKSDYLCNTCGKYFNNNQHRKFYQHLKSHTKYPCDECPKVFTSKYNYDNHKKSHADGQLCCKICGRQFTQPRRLRIHMSYVHREGKQLQCQMCPKQFRHPGTLKRHSKKHTSSPNNFVCSVCEKIYLSREGLIIHIRSHTGERPFSCQYCDSHFSSEGYRREHERLHTGETPFKCPICFKGFAQKGNMRSHFIHNHRESNFKESMMLYKKSEELQKSLTVNLPVLNVT